MLAYVWGPKNLVTLRTVARPFSTVKHASSLEELLCKIWSFDFKRCGGVGTILEHLGTVRQTVRACGPVEPWLSRPPMVIGIHGVLALTTIMSYSNHGSISYVYSFRGKRRHRSKKQCFPTPDVVPPVPLLSEIWGHVPPPALWRGAYGRWSLLPGFHFPHVDLQCIDIFVSFLPAGCHGNLTVLNLLSASVTKNQHLRPCRKNYALDRKND